MVDTYDRRRFDDQWKTVKRRRKFTEKIKHNNIEAEKPKRFSDLCALWPVGVFDRGSPRLKNPTGECRVCDTHDRTTLYTPIYYPLTSHAQSPLFTTRYTGCETVGGGSGAMMFHTNSLTSLE